MSHQAAMLECEASFVLEKFLSLCQTVITEVIYRRYLQRDKQTERKEETKRKCIVWRARNN